MPREMSGHTFAWYAKRWLGWRDGDLFRELNGRFYLPPRCSMIRLNHRALVMKVGELPVADIPPEVPEMRGEYFGRWMSIFSRGSRFARLCATISHPFMYLSARKRKRGNRFS